MNIILKLVDCTRSKHNLTLLYQFHEVTFTTTLWYPTVDFHQLEAEYSQEYMERLYFHILLFHGLKILSLKPTHLDLSKYAKYWTPDLKILWDQSVEQCLGQWRYETNNLAYPGAEVIEEAIDLAKSEAVTLIASETPLLVCNGGGKDSLLMARLLDERNIRFDSYSINIHTHDNPETLLEWHEAHLYGLDNPPAKMHRHYIMESFLNSPAAKLHGVAGLDVSDIRNYEDLPLAYGIFGILPTILMSKYTQVCYGNEKSADADQVEVEQQAINHAWCKSTECEVLYEEYVCKTFVENLSIFSFIKPCTDTFVYRILANKLRDNELSLVYACNTKPPWCKACPKCAYVWLSFMAYLKPEHLKDVNNAFGEENLFNLPELQLYYRQLMGLEAHNAFECVGEFDEVKLAFEKCIERGLTGEAVDCYLREARLSPTEHQTLWVQHNELDFSYQRLPEQLMDILIEESKNLTPL